MENGLITFLFPSLCYKFLLQGNREVREDEAPDQLWEPHKQPRELIIGKSNSGSRVEVYEKQGQEDRKGDSGFFPVQS